jgi:hypothetical protein
MLYRSIKVTKRSIYQNAIAICFLTLSWHSCQQILLPIMNPIEHPLPMQAWNLLPYQPPHHLLLSISGTLLEPHSMPSVFFTNIIQPLRDLACSQSLTYIKGNAIRSNQVRAKLASLWGCRVLAGKVIIRIIIKQVVCLFFPPYLFHL